MEPSSLPSRVLIREVGPREGFQILPKAYPIRQRLELINALVRASLRSIEVVSFVRGDKVPQMADAEQLVQQLPQAAGVEFTGLYLNERGFERGEKTGRLANAGWLYTSPSGTFLRHNSNSSVDQTVAAVSGWSKLFRQHGKGIHGLMVSNSFGCAFEGAVSPATVISLIERFLAACQAAGERLHEICLADTVGMANPESVRRLVAALRPLGIPVSLHLHDTFGLGIANVYAGLLEGVSIFEASIGGLGGCPFTPGAAGNVATEDVVYLCHQIGIETGVQLDLLLEAARLAEFIIGTPLPGRVYRAHSAQKKV